MTETKQILEALINDYAVDKFILFFRAKSRLFVAREEHYSRFNDDRFRQGIKLGEIHFPDGDGMLICAFAVQKDLAERSGKKAQYDKAKMIMKADENRKYSAGIFIFYDPQGSFRFSLVYPESIGTKRQWNNFRRFTYYVSAELTNKTFKLRVGDGDFSNLAKIKEAFSVEKVTKEFYESIANWYFWAVDHSRFPKDAEIEKNGRNIAVIRLITRMIFVWFMRERGLMPKDIFEETKINTILKNTSADDTTYYRAILQNLFFATLSTKKEERQFCSEVRGHKGLNPDFNNPYVFRYQELFNDPEVIKQLFGDIPYLNGGLFECLDVKEDRIYIDGFSRTKKNQPDVPNFLFFGKEQMADLNRAYGTMNKKYMVRGLLGILSSFNFTIDENSPDDQDIALDPELLGRVFENLLASFNPETSSTARKATGSYYTPREIVNYMVTESLKEYFRTHLKGIDGIDDKLEQLFSNGSQENPFNEKESSSIVKLIESVKIVDPAVGSGAFPMGALNKLVFILNKVDSGNELWKQVQLKATEAIPDYSVRQVAKARIEEYFKDKNADYGRKLYLIQKCIYGVDIQQIAVEIAKLRFFISLLVDERIDKTKDNWGIEPLPNLDFKIMQGNSLLEEYEGVKLFDEKLFAGIDYGKDNLIKSIKQRQVELQKECLDLHAKNKLTKVKQTELYSELKRIDKQLKSLSKPNDKSEEQAGLFDFQNEAFQKKDMLKRLHKEFFETNEKEQKSSLKKQIEKIYWDLIEITLKEQNKTSALKKIDQFKKSNTKPFFLWKLHFAEVFENGGFDLVIGNPPYMIIQTLSEAVPTLINSYKYYYKSATGKFDLYCIFTEKGISLLSKTGVLNYIMPSKWTVSSFGVGLREIVSTSNLLFKLISFDSFQVFNASTYSSLLWLKASNGKYAQIIKLDKDLANEAELNNWLANDVEKRMVTINTNILNKNPWILSNASSNKILSGINRYPPISTYLEGVFQGIVTGDNDVFWLYDCIISNDNISGYSRALNKQVTLESSIVFPFLNGKTIGRYTCKANNTYIIYPYKNTACGTELLSEQELRRNYPQVYSYLIKLKDRLENRGSKTMTYASWYSLWNQRNYERLQKPNKILTPDICNRGSLWKDREGGFFHSDTSYAIIIKGKYQEYLNTLYLILNSSLLWFYLQNTGAVQRGGFFRFKTSYIKPFPVPNIGQEYISIFDLLETFITTSMNNNMNKIQSFIECLVDALVYELYLSDEIKSADAEVLKHLTNLPELKEDWSEEKKLKAIEKVYKDLSDPQHPVSIAMSRQKTVPEVRIIEGLDK